MTNKSTKKALALSIISLVVCVSMLVGTTFAWFTDSVTSTNNIIKSGNLDVELYYQMEGQTDWTKVDKDTNIFKKDALWEPGYTEVVKLKVVNEGSLALKYRLGVNVASETPATNVLGNEFNLSDYIYFGVVDGDKSFDRAGAVSAVKDSAVAVKDGYASNGELFAKGTDGKASEAIVTMVVYMPETVGNEANHKTGVDAPVINLGVNLFATQFTYESDSFGSDYDKGAPWTGTANTDWYFDVINDDPDATEFTIESAEELAGFAALVNGTATAPTSTFALTNSAPATVQDCFAEKTVKLAADLDLHDISWTPIGRIGTTSTDFSYSFKGTFDGQGHVISNLKVDNSGWAGLFGIAHGATINNVKLSGVTVMSNRMAGSLVGQLYGSIDNCHVEKANIFVIPNAVGDSFDNGDKVGGIVGWLGDNGNNRTLTNCSATEIEVSAYRDVGGIAGYVASSTTVSGNKVEKVEVIADQTTNYYGDKAVNAGFIYGRTGGTITESNNIVDDESSIEATYNEDGLTFRSDENNEVTLYLVPTDYNKTTVTVPEGVDAIGGYAFAYNKNIEKIVLPSSVTTLNDRAFRETSASEVVLNEGLQKISYQAFRDALNVTSVEIPSTVTTISKEAFQNSGITTLTVPETVTALEYGAMRDMKKLETVTIEGNVDIPVYAFRACTNLRTVILKGDDVTFGGGARGMIFTNKENGDGTAITVYVANETVKDRLLAADTAAKDYGGYKIVVTDGAEFVSNATDFKSALTDSNSNGVVISGKVAAEDIAYFNTANDATVIGGTISRDTASGNPVLVNTTNKVTFQGVAFESEKGSAVLATRKEGANIEVNDCTFTNHSSPSTGNTGVQVYASNVTMVFNNCTFNNMPVVTNSSYPEGIKLEFNNCKLNWVGDNCSGLVQIANNLKITVDFNDCEFSYKTDSQYTTAKNLVSYNWPEAATVNFNNVKVVGERNNDKIWRICSSNNQVTVNVNGTATYTFNGNAVDFNTYLK